MNLSAPGVRSAPTTRRVLCPQNPRSIFITLAFQVDLGTGRWEASLFSVTRHAASLAWKSACFPCCSRSDFDVLQVTTEGLSLWCLFCPASVLVSLSFCLCQSVGLSLPLLSLRESLSHSFPGNACTISWFSLSLSLSLSLTHTHTHTLSLSLSRLNTHSQGSVLCLLFSPRRGL